MKAAGLKQDRDAAETCDLIHLAPVKGDHVAVFVLDVCASDEGNVFADSVTRPSEDIQFFRAGQVIDVAGIHVDGVHQTRTVRVLQVKRVGLLGDAAIRLQKWQQRRGNAADLCAQVFCVRAGFRFSSLRFRGGQLRHHDGVFVVAIERIASRRQAVPRGGGAVAEGATNSLVLKGAPVGSVQKHFGISQRHAPQADSVDPVHPSRNAAWAT